MLFIIIVIAYNNNSVRQKSRFTLKRYSVSNFLEQKHLLHTVDSFCSQITPSRCNFKIFLII